MHVKCSVSSGSWLAPKRQLLFNQCRDFSETSTLWTADRQTSSWLSSTPLFFFCLEIQKYPPSFYAPRSCLLPLSLCPNEKKVGEIKFSSYFFPFLLPHTEVDCTVSQVLQDPLLPSLSASKQTLPVSQMGLRGNTDWSLLDYTRNWSDCQVVTC